MTESITPKEAAALLKQRLGFSVTASAIYHQAMRNFKHLAVMSIQGGSAGKTSFHGINKSAWLNFLSGRNAAKSARELFSMEF